MFHTGKSNFLLPQRGEERMQHIFFGFVLYFTKDVVMRGMKTADSGNCRLSSAAWELFRPRRDMMGSELKCKTWSIVSALSEIKCFLPPFLSPLFFLLDKFIGGGDRFGEYSCAYCTNCWHKWRQSIYKHKIHQISDQNFEVFFSNLDCTSLFTTTGVQLRLSKATVMRKRAGET